MRGKQIIITLFIIGALAAAGVFAYLSLTGSSSELSGSAVGVPANPILPHGTSLDFDTVNSYNETGRKFQYPSVTPADAGLPLNEIMQQ